MTHSDVECIRRVLDGDDTAFAELVKKYQKPVHALVWRKIGDFHIAEELTQDTFLKAYQKLATLKEPQRFASWLYVIATRRCIAWLRKKRLWTQSLEETSHAQLEQATYSGYVIAENERVSVEAQREVVKKLLATLEESERTVVTLRYFGEMSSAEIGEFLGVSANTVRSRLRRALQRLKKEEPMIREALEHFQLTPSLTENIMREVSRINPIAPSGGKPLVPWTVAASTIAVVFLMLGIGNQYLSHFQKPYSFEASSEMTVELIDARVVRDLAVKPDVRTQLGNSAASGKSNSSEQRPGNTPVLLAAAESDETVEDYTRWELPEKAKTRLGKGGINAIQFSPDGTQLAVGSNIGVWLYDVRTAKEISLFAGMCQCLAFSPDGRFLASGAGGGPSRTEIQMWEMATGREVPLEGLYESSAALRFSSDGKTLVSLSHSGDAIGRLDIETGKGKMKHFKTGLFGIGLFSSEKFGSGVYAITQDKVALGKEDGKIQLWDIKTREKLSTLRGHIDFPLQPLEKPSRLPRGWKKQVLALAFSPDGTHLASGSRDKTVRLWSTTGDDKWLTLQKHTGWVNVLAFSPDGERLASGSTDKTVQLWEIATGELLATLTGHLNGITALAFSPDGTTLASGSMDGTVRFWNTETGDPLAIRITEHTAFMRSVSFFKNSFTLASVAFNGIITFWDVRTSRELTSQNTGHRDWLLTLAFSPDGTKLASLGADGNIISGFGSWHPDPLIRLTDVSTGRELATQGQGPTKLTFSPDGRTVASGGFGKIRLWNTETGEVQDIPFADIHIGGNIGNGPRVSALAFSPDGTRLFSGTQGGKIQMWDVATGSALGAFAELTDRDNLGDISALAFSPSGALLAAGTHHQLHLWEVNTGNKLLSLNTEHKRGWIIFKGGYNELLVFSPDSAVLVNGLGSGGIQLWDVVTGKKIATLDGHTEKVETLVFSPDGKTLVSTSQDGTILLWDWEEALKGASVPRSR